VAPYGAFATADGAIMIGISNDRLFRRLCAAMGRNDWAEDSRYGSNSDRVRNRAELEGQLADLVRLKPTIEWMQIFREFDVPGDAVQNAEQVLADPQLAAIGQLAEVALAGEDAATVPRLPIGLSLTPAGDPGALPELGEHGQAILQEAGYSDTEIEQLVRGGACAIGARESCES
jgi:crotonobetainyl-CoA:carnitine CoA-transferase CaiB-like acyl-CoA transferase